MKLKLSLQFNRLVWHRILPRFRTIRSFRYYLAILLFLILFSGRSYAATTDTNWPAVVEAMSESASWIWDHRTEDFQTCRFWKKFKIPNEASVKNAYIQITADNGYRFFLDGREIGQAGEWQRVIEYDISAILEPGTHVLAVEAFNGTLFAGMILNLRAELANGRIIKVGTDATWRIVPSDESGWEKKNNPGPAWRRAKVVQLAHWRPRITTGPILQPIKVKFWQTGVFQIALISTCTAVALFCLYLMTQLAVQRKSQRLLQLERLRLARDLHDDLGAAITQIILFGEVTQRELPDGTNTRAKLDQLCNRMRGLAGAINEVVWVVNPQRDTLGDFSTYICKYAETFLRAASIRCRFDVATEFPGCSFDLPVRRNLFLAVKEALNNAAKHSGATEVILTIACANQVIRVVVADNGKGFDPQRPTPDRNGLKNMAQRMKELGGSCALASEPGKGCRVEFVMPLSDARLGSRWFRAWRSGGNATLGAPENLSENQVHPAHGTIVL
ncbi:MAG: Integral rane sensor signal transduction histidine kinase [Pedosphaera sp.]|nr:Integral rane sensor signal transduction histidine kinase [Pedosphaera sp.]